MQVSADRTSEFKFPRQVYIKTISENMIWSHTFWTSQYIMKYAQVQFLLGGTQCHTYAQTHGIATANAWKYTAFPSISNCLPVGIAQECLVSLATTWWAFRRSCQQEVSPITHTQGGVHSSNAMMKLSCLESSNATHLAYCRDGCQLYLANW